MMVSALKSNVHSARARSRHRRGQGGGSMAKGLVSVMWVALLFCGSLAAAECTSIAQPDSDYRQNTNTCLLGPFLSFTQSCRDDEGNDVATFDPRLQVRTCFEWSCWSL